MGQNVYQNRKQRKDLLGSNAFSSPKYSVVLTTAADSKLLASLWFILQQFVSILVSFLTRKLSWIL